MPGLSLVAIQFNACGARHVVNACAARHGPLSPHQRRSFKTAFLFGDLDLALSISDLELLDLFLFLFGDLDLFGDREVLDLFGDLFRDLFSEEEVGDLDLGVS